MDKITRYLILVFIIIIFVILAPLIVIYVSGKNVQLGNLLAKDTGIIDIQSSPSSAEVYIDGVKNNTTPTTVRFVKQGIHNIEVRKNGFRTWKKNLFIEAGKVTYAGTLANEVKLLPDETPLLLSSSNVESYAMLDDDIIFHAQNNQLLKYNLNDKKITLQTELPIEISNIENTNTKKYLSATTKVGKNILIDTETLKLVNIPEALASDISSLYIDDDNNMLAIKDRKLIFSNLNNGQVIPLLENALAFTINNNVLYAASWDSDDLKLDTYLWDGAALSSRSNLLTQKLTLGKNYQLWLTYQKELFLLVDEDFYKVNQKLDLLNKNVKSVQLDKIHRQLTYQTLSEIYYYNFLSNKAELFYRTSQITEPSLVVPNTGYGFVPNENGLSAIEIDNRNGQNSYAFVSGSSISKIAITNDENNLLFLDNNKLYTVAIAK